MAAPKPSRILVIKLGALGDFIQALGPFAAIRRHHANAHVTLLTTNPFAAFAVASGYFNDVWTGGRPAGLDPVGWFGLRRHLRKGGFERVYDLQTSARSSFYHRLFWSAPYPEWSGIAAGCSHPHDNPRRDFMHTFDRQAEQLKMAGIADVPPPDLSWVKADIGRLQLKDRFALLVPGGAVHRPGKRWPEERFSELARWLAEREIEPVLLGSDAEAGLLSAIANGCPGFRNLAGKTDLFDIATLAGAASLSVGNDTGPMHLIAAAGCPSLVLYSADSNPALCGQRGADVTILGRQWLSALSVEEVTGMLANKLAS
ncbi:MAG TPA: glycosyltransferase family 9 protein [Rhodospirillales bacterium]|jgi:ADP-heptose:LPS heptosyltransferase|nr:glycosyltransferase family 9 protein [Rhodospirillales bacterium]